MLSGLSVSLAIVFSDSFVSCNLMSWLYAPSRSLVSSACEPDQLKDITKHLALWNLLKFVIMLESKEERNQNSRGMERSKPPQSLARVRRKKEKTMKADCWLRLYFCQNIVCLPFSTIFPS